VLIGNPAVGVKLMLVSTGSPSRTAARTRAIAEVGEDAPPLGSFRSGQTSQFSHQERIGEPVKPVVMQDDEIPSWTDFTTAGGAVVGLLYSRTAL
jgi:hypothetical protein